MSLTGRLVAADEALRMGLVVAIVPPADLLPTALAMAADITSADQAATRVMVSEYRRTSIPAGALEAEVETAEQFLRGGIEAEVIEQRRRDIMARNRAAMR
jgi:enoyl-CoA hydratase/carnithine racemase